MFVSDLSFIFNWWFTLAILGLIFLPLTSIIFRNFFDRGYIFSRIIGLLLLTYTIWLLASFKILPYDTYSLFSLLISFLILNFYIAKKTYFLEKFKKHWKIFLFEEFLFLAGLIFWSFIRAHEPSIHGLEKYMDFGFINSILRSEYFPPKDLWLAPESINYYYFGHVIVATLTKLSFLDSRITYNLMVATLFAFTFMGSFSIGGNLVNLSSLNLQIQNLKIKILIGGILTSFLVALAGNLHTIYLFFQNYNVDNPVPFWQLQPQLNSSYWYPNATRFIPFTIHEFPIYSSVVADLHGHFLNIPIVLLTIAFLISLYFNGRIHLGYLISFSFLIGVMLMTNILDGPIYVLLFTLILLVKNRVRLERKLILILLFSFLFSLPFWLSFKPFGSGIGLLCAPDFLTAIGNLSPFIFEKDHCAHSPLWMLLVLYGFFYAVALGYILKIRKNITESDRLILLLLLFSTILLAIPEFFYVKDIYPAHFRANTVFKFHFQAFIILGLASGYMILKIIQKFRLSLLNLIYLAIIFLLFFLVMLYPFIAVKSYYGDLKDYRGLDGLNYLELAYPSDYHAILWIRNNIKDQPVILEATGDSYTDYARVSSNTGLPTILGWYVHEWLWRGTTDEVNIRTEDIKLLYESTDSEKIKELIKKYNISLIFIGDLEKQKYPQLNENKFSELGRIIFQEEDTRIYQLN
ncbi:MAG: chlorArchYYY domain protein [Microgenomates group bacterium Gr01-1014_7]|nr:MAG: chlorArchYYY domain protein [Microgenomates group bacterium Gr01-1014_7]